MQRRDNQGGRLLMRTSARPRLPDGDCVFISDVRIVARANACRYRCRYDRPGFAPRSIPAHIAFSVSKLKKSSFETEKKRMMARADRRCVHGAALGTRGHPGHRGDHGDAPLRQVRTHKGVLCLRRSEESVRQLCLHRPAGPRHHRASEKHPRTVSRNSPLRPRGQVLDRITRPWIGAI